jgi:hypothetical protein
MRRNLIGPASAALVLFALVVIPMRRAAAQSASCESRPADSVFAVNGPVFRECGVSVKAKLLTTDLKPEFTPPSGPGCWRVQYEFVVNAAGLVDPTTARLVKTNSKRLGEAYRAMLSQYRFEPAILEGKPVAQIVEMGLEVAPDGKVPFTIGKSSRGADPASTERAGC